MSIVALAGGVAVYFMLRPYLLIAEGPPVLRYFKGNGSSIGCWSSYRGDWQDGLKEFSEPAFATATPLLVGLAFIAALTALYGRGIALAGSPPASFDIAFALVWAVGIACALGAAYLAKFHRLAALILLGGAGLVTCISFVWLSAPDLALTVRD